MNAGADLRFLLMLNPQAHIKSNCRGTGLFRQGPTVQLAVAMGRGDFPENCHNQCCPCYTKCVLCYSSQPVLVPATLSVFYVTVHNQCFPCYTMCFIFQITAMREPDRIEATLLKIITTSCLPCYTMCFIFQVTPSSIPATRCVLYSRSLPCENPTV